MEAESYLTSGFGLRTAIESKPDGWARMEMLANSWMPGRLAGIHVDREYGTPYLAATQVFDSNPTPRKWLALAQMRDAESRFVNSGQILVTRSGAVGRTTLAYSVHEDVVISDDLIRVDPDKIHFGWVYAFLRSRQALAMCTGAKYGHVIKHLEPAHLENLPVPLIDEDAAKEFTSMAKKVVRLRNKSLDLMQQANDAFADAIGQTDQSERVSFTASVSDMVFGRRRLEGAFYNPDATEVIRRFKKSEPLSQVTERIWWMNRFKRFYGDGGLPYLSADTLFAVNPLEEKRILVSANDSHEEFFVKRGWIVMACSGQVYGLNGAAALMTKHHEKKVFTHDLIRIIVDESKVRQGYVVTALTHPTHGRPVLIRAAYGTSVPHLDPGDVADFPLVRLGKKAEGAIADLAESSAQARADADALDRKISDKASTIIDRFIATKQRIFQRDTQQLARHILDSVAPDE